MRNVLLAVSILSLSTVAFAEDQSGNPPAKDATAKDGTMKKTKHKKVKDSETGGAGTAGNTGSPGAGMDVKGSR